MRNNNQNIKKITFEPEQIKLAEYKASKLGINFQEYIKYLVAKDTENITDKFSLIDLDQICEIEDGIDESKHLKFIAEKHRGDLRKLIKSWREEGL